jgi:ABC-type uncharacterized transport system permease subunit
LLRLISYSISAVYLLVCVAYIMAYLREDGRLKSTARPFAATAALLHLAYLLTLSFSIKHHPITTVFEAASTLAFMISILYLYMDIRHGARSAGIFVFFFIFLLQAVSSVFIKLAPSEYRMMSGFVLPAHIYTALMGYSSFATGFLFSLMYMILHRDIRSGGFGRIFRHFPSLEHLDDLNYRAILAGLFLLFISIILGFIWYNTQFDALPLFDAKVMFTLFAWMLYAIVVVFRRIFGWHGGRIAVMSMVGFIIVMASFTIVNLLARSFHAHF